MAELKGTREEILNDLLWVAQESLRTNLVHGTAGNFSARLPDGNVVLTPSSLPYETMTIEDLVVTDLDANVLEGKNGPTTEKMLPPNLEARSNPRLPPAWPGSGPSRRCHN
jgi:ribulose-5-phosphate 4-epimerase/fuculose-1-phosphate aldolase